MKFCTFALGRGKKQKRQKNRVLTRIYVSRRRGVGDRCQESGTPFHLSTITASLPFSWTHLVNVENIMGILLLIASICFLCKMGEIGSVLVASINIFVNNPPLSSTRRSNVVFRKRQHCDIGAKIVSSS